MGIAIGCVGVVVVAGGMENVLINITLVSSVGLQFLKHVEYVVSSN